MSSRRSFFFAAIAVAIFATDAVAQQRQITGRVTTEGGDPLPSASVTVAGTPFATYTDNSGEFRVAAPSGQVTLRVRRIGYVARTVDVPMGQGTVSVALARDILQLERAVVTGTATTVSSQNAANAVAVISGEQLNRAPTQTVENAMQGKIPGAVITSNTGAPGGGIQVQLRGVTSINATSSPLYVIDGAVVSNTAISSGLMTVTQSSRGVGISTQDVQVNRIADLNPADIEDISVLKGASSAAIYGSRASNGVIIITTKRGRPGAPVFRAIQRLGWFELSNKLNLRCFSSQAEATAAGMTTTPWQPECIDFEEEFYGNKELSYETDLSARGGNEGTTYFISGLIKRDAGIQKGTGYNKRSLRVNVGQQLGSRWNVTAFTQLVHSMAERGISGNDNANISPYNVFSYTPTFYDLRCTDVCPRNPWGGPNGDNPFQDILFFKTPENVFRFIASVNSNYSLIRNERQSLDFVAQGGLDRFDQDNKILSPRNLYFEPGDQLPGTVVNRISGNLLGTMNLSLVHKFFPASQWFTATTSLGLRQGREKFESVFTAGQDLLIGQIDVDKATTITTFETNTLVKDFAYYAQEELLLLNERLLVTGGANFERSSVNGDDKKFYVYPKVSAAYRLPWLPPYTNDFKLRIAYGQAGNKPGYGQKFTPLVSGVYDAQVGLRPALGFGNLQIKPETSTELEGGLDARLFDGRVGLEITGYRKDIDDLVLTASRAASTGFTSQVINGGSFVNRGYEIGLTAVPLEIGRFSWLSTTTYSQNRAKVTSLPVPAFNTGGFGLRYGATRIEVGKSPTAIIGRDGWDSTFRNTAGALVKRGDPGCAPDVPPATCGTFVSRADHLNIIGDAMPKFQMGFSNDLTFGPFRLASLFDWRHGHYISNLTADYFASDLLADTADTRQRQTLAASGGGRSARAFVEEASFLKLRELALSYELPIAFTRRFLRGDASSARIEVSGRNLRTWTKYGGLDPEVSNFGNQNLNRYFDVTTYPPSRSIFFSIDLTL